MPPLPPAASLLPRDELVGIIASLGSGRGGPRWGAFDEPYGTWSLANGLIGRLPDWVGVAGLLAGADGEGYLLYLGPSSRPGRLFPSAVTLRLGPGRYSVETWDAGARAVVGLETASAPPLVCGPPASGFQLLARVVPLR